MSDLGERLRALRAERERLALVVAAAQRTIARAEQEKAAHRTSGKPIPYELRTRLLDACSAVHAAEFRIRNLRRESRSLESQLNPD